MRSPTLVEVEADAEEAVAEEVVELVEAEAAAEAVIADDFKALDIAEEQAEDAVDDEVAELVIDEAAADEALDAEIEAVAVAEKPRRLIRPAARTQLDDDPPARGGSSRCRGVRSAATRERSAEGVSIRGGAGWRRTG